MALHSKKCPHCGFVGEYEPGPLTVCERCGEVLAESWALQEAVTDIMGDDSWIHKFRQEHPDMSGGQPEQAIPGMIGPGKGSLAGLFSGMAPGAETATPAKPEPPQFSALFGDARPAAPSPAAADLGGGADAPPSRSSPLRPQVASSAVALAMTAHVEPAHRDHPAPAEPAPQVVFGTAAGAEPHLGSGAPRLMGASPPERAPPVFEQPAPPPPGPNDLAFGGDTDFDAAFALALGHGDDGALARPFENAGVLGGVIPESPVDTNEQNHPDTIDFLEPLPGVESSLMSAIEVEANRGSPVIVGSGAQPPTVMREAPAVLGTPASMQATSPSSAPGRMSAAQAGAWASAPPTPPRPAVSASPPPPAAPEPMLPRGSNGPPSLSAFSEEPARPGPAPRMGGSLAGREESTQVTDPPEPPKNRAPSPHPAAPMPTHERPEAQTLPARSLPPFPPPASGFGLNALPALSQDTLRTNISMASQSSSTEVEAIIPVDRATVPADTATLTSYKQDQNQKRTTPRGKTAIRPAKPVPKKSWVEQPRTRWIALACVLVVALAATAILVAR